MEMYSWDLRVLPKSNIGRRRGSCRNFSPSTENNSGEMLQRYSFAWGAKKKRSESSPSPSTQRRIVESTPEKVTVVEADKSPSTSLCFLPSGSGSDGADKPKLRPPSSVKQNLKRKVTDDLVESYNKMQQERENLLRETKAMKTLHQELTSANLKLKAIMQKVNYSKDFQQSYQQQNTMFVPPTPPQHCQQLVVDPNNGKLVVVSCSGNNYGGGKFGMFNQIDPRVKIHGEAYDFMGCSIRLIHVSTVAAGSGGGGWRWWWLTGLVVADG